MRACDFGGKTAADHLTLDCQAAAFDNLGMERIKGTNELDALLQRLVQAMRYVGLVEELVRRAHGRGEEVVELTRELAAAKGTLATLESTVAHTFSPSIAQPADATVIAVDHERHLFALRTGQETYSVLRCLSKCTPMEGDRLTVPSKSPGVHILRGMGKAIVALSMTSYMDGSSSAAWNRPFS